MLDGRRILIVEDEAIVAFVAEDAITDAGGIVVGPVSRLSDGLEIAQSEDFDAAVLDINLRGEKVFPLADLLRDKGVPFVFTTGYEQVDWQGDAVKLDKPYDEESLVKVLSSIL